MRRNDVPVCWLRHVGDWQLLREGRIQCAQPEPRGQPTTQQPAEFDVWLCVFMRSTGAYIEGSRLLPSSLRSLTFGYAFNRSLKGSRPPNSLQSLMSGGTVNVRLEGTLAELFNSLRSWNSSLQSLMSGCEFNQSLEGTQLPSSVRSLAFGYAFHRSQEGSRQSSSFWTDQCCYMRAMRPCADGDVALGHAVHRRNNWDRRGALEQELSRKSEPCQIVSSEACDLFLMALWQSSTLPICLSDRATWVELRSGNRCSSPANCSLVRCLLGMRVCI